MVVKINSLTWDSHSWTLDCHYQFPWEPEQPCQPSLFWCNDCSTAVSLCSHIVSCCANPVGLTHISIHDPMFNNRHKYITEPYYSKNDRFPCILWKIWNILHQILCYHLLLWKEIVRQAKRYKNNIHACVMCVLKKNGSSSKLTKMIEQKQFWNSYLKVTTFHHLTQWLGKNSFSIHTIQPTYIHVTFWPLVVIGTTGVKVTRQVKTDKIICFCCWRG